MAKAETVTLRIGVVGTDDAIAAIERCKLPLQESCDRLVSMGWTPAMADTFIGEIAGKIVRELVKVENADR